jgi:hypothetical protein
MRLNDQISILAIAFLFVLILSAFSVRAQSGGTFQLEQIVIASGRAASGGTFSTTNVIGEPTSGRSLMGGRFQIGTGYFATPPLLPTAAPVIIGGRVLTPDGQPISGVRISLLNSAGVVKTALSNAFGYFRFYGVPAGQTYILAATAKNHEFAPQVVTVDNEIGDLDLISLD